MDFEDSMSSWIGKLREGFDTFCSEAKDFLPKIPVQNVQEQLAKAAENLKQFCSDLDIFSSFDLDSEHGNGQISDETEENMYYSHAETKSSDEKKDVTESSEREGPVRFCRIPVEVEHGTFRYYPLSIGEPNSFESSPIIQDCTNLLGLTRNLKELELHHPPVMESFTFSDDDVHESYPSTPDYSSDAESETQNSHWSVRSSTSLPFEETEKSSRSSDNEVTSSDDYTPRTINSTFDYDSQSGLFDIFSFLDSDSDSTFDYDSQSGLFDILSFLDSDSDSTFDYDSQSGLFDIFSFLDSDSDSTFDYDSQSGLFDIMSFLDSDSASIPDMSACWSKRTPSPVSSDISESIQDYAEIMKEKEWESLDADFNDDDWEIV